MKKNNKKKKKKGRSRSRRRGRGFGHKPEDVNKVNARKWKKKSDFGVEHSFPEFIVNVPEDQYLESCRQKSGQREVIRLAFRRVRPLLRVYRFIRSDKIAWHIYHMTGFSFKTDPKPKSVSPYQLMLKIFVEKMDFILAKNPNLPNPIPVTYNDIGGYDLFNASASPWFKQNLLLVHTGVFWYCHVFGLSLEPLVRRLMGKGRLLGLRRYFERKFMRMAMAFLLNDHEESFSLFHFGYDPGLSRGFEFFIVGHEYAHLLIAHHGIESFDFNKYFSDSIIAQIEENEEIAADAIGLILLKHFSEETDCDVFLYAPSLLFLILSFFEQEGLYPVPVDEHPSAVSRVAYIRKMIQELNNEYRYEKVDLELKRVWNSRKGKMIRKFKKKLKKEISVLKLFQEAQLVMVNKGYPALISFKS